MFLGGNRSLTVAANSTEEKLKWKEDLVNAIQQARDKTDTKTTYLSLKSCSECTLLIIVCLYSISVCVQRFYCSFVFIEQDLVSFCSFLHVSNHITRAFITLLAFFLLEFY